VLKEAVNYKKCRYTVTVVVLFMAKRKHSTFGVEKINRNDANFR